MKYFTPAITQLTQDVTAQGPGIVPATVANRNYYRYVDFGNGDDTNGTGSQLRPWKTLQHAYNALQPLASINFPYTIILSGGNNDTDASPITGYANINLYSDAVIQINQPITITSTASNENIVCTNLIFIGAFTWVRNDFWQPGITFINCEFFSGPVIKQQGTGSFSITAVNSVFVNADFQLPNFGSFFTNCTFLGSTTTFRDANSNAYYEIMGGYNSSTISVSGGAELYLSGVICDTPFGAGLSGTTTANGTPLFQFDSGSVPPSISGSFTTNLMSLSQWMDFTTGAHLGGLGSPTASNTLLQVSDGHVKSTQTTVPTTTTSVNAGTGASSSVSNATDTAGVLNLTSGSGSFSAGVQCTVNFNKAYNVAPIVMVTPANASAAEDGGSLHHIYVTSTVNGFSINFGVQQNTNGKQYVWNYWVIETQ